MEKQYCTSAGASRLQRHGPSRTWISQGLAILATGLLAAGCGGGGGGGGSSIQSPPPSGGGGGGGSGGGGSGGGDTGGTGTALVGQFKDSNVEGLSYRTASRSGSTDARGRYEYEANEQVTFSIGGVELGSGPARRMFTPIDLGTDGSTDSARVQNVVRFLMMLDRDADPTNGILISQAVRDMAENWQQVDLETADLDSALVTILSDVASVDGRTPQLPDRSAARAHLEATLFCTLSGVFQGNFTGSRSGAVTIVVRPNGQAHAIGPGSGEFFGAARPLLGRDRTIELTRVTDGATLRAVFADENRVSGTWSLGSESGEFSASREFGSADATWRFTGFWAYDRATPSVLRQNVLDVDASGNVSGWFQDTTNGNTGTGQGTLSASVLQVSWSSGARGSATFDPVTQRAEGTWTGTNSGTFEVDGCRLN